MYVGEDNYIPFTSLSDTPIEEWQYAQPHIPEEYLGEGGAMHEMTKENKWNFLRQLGITESDSIYIFDLKLNKLIVVSINALPFMAIPNVYSHGDPLNVDDYMIGITYPEELLAESDSYYYHILVHVGSSNPFELGRAYPIILKEIDENTYLSQVENDSIANVLYSGIGGRKTYFFHAENLDYYFLSLGLEYPFAGHLAVYYEGTDVQLFSHYFNGGEGSSLARLSHVGQDSTNYLYQWTGKILKDYPPITFGFLSHSFGCARIYVMDDSGTWIRILCDNRH